MKKEKNLTYKIVVGCFATIPLSLTILFTILAINNPGTSSIKFIVMACFLGVISIAIYIGLIAGIILSKIEKKVLQNGFDAEGRIVSAKFILGGASYPDVFSRNEEEYNNKPICENGRYRIKIAFENKNGKNIQKTALSPFLNKYQLSYLVEKGNINIKVYKNKFAFTQEMLETEIEKMPQDQKVLKLKNDKVKIKTGLYFAKSKTTTNCNVASTNEYNLYVKKRSSINNVAQVGDDSYICFVKYYAVINGERKYFIKYLNIRDFSRVQANQKENLPLPILIKDNNAYIDFDNLPIV